MISELEERLVFAFERIATALEGINDTKQRQFAKQWPERKEVHEAVYSRVPSEEDLIREGQGASDGSLEEWLTPPEDEFIGQREKEFLETQAAAARAQAASKGEPNERGAEAPEDQAGTAGGGSTDHAAV